MEKKSTNNLLLTLRMKIGLGILFLLMMVVQSWGQTDNYFGTSGTISGSVWNTNPAGPYTNALVTTGGTILNFNNAGSATGATLTPQPVGMNFGAAITWTSGGTIGANSVNVIFNVSSGITQDMGSTQSISSGATAAFTKNGLGALRFPSASGYGGGFTLNSGTLIIGNTNVFGNGTININGGVITTNSGTARVQSSPTSMVIGANFQFGDAVNFSSGSGDIEFPATCPVSLGNVTRTITIGGIGAYKFNGVISNPSTSAGLTIAKTASGTGSVVLTNQNTYTGLTTVASGILQLTASLGNTLPVGNSVTVNSGGILTISTAQQLNNITVDVGGTLILAAPLTITGTPTINGTLQINSGGSINVVPTYGSASTLVYNTGTAISGTGNEWTGGGSVSPTAGSGVPGNVTISLASTNLSLSADRGTPGAINIGAGAALTLNAGDLYVGGDWSLNATGTFTHSNKKVIMVAGTSPATITGANTFFNLDISKGSTNIARFGTSTTTTIANNLTITTGDLQGHPTTSGTAIINVSGNLSIASGSSLVQGTSSGAFTLNLSGNLDCSAGGIINTGSNTSTNTINFLGSGKTINMGIGAHTFSKCNVAFGNPSSYSLTGNGFNFYTNGSSNRTFTLNTNASLDLNGQTLTLDNSTIAIAGGGTLVANGIGSTVSYAASSSQTVKAIAYYNLNIGGGSSSIKTTEAGFTTTVTNQLTMNGSSSASTMAVGVASSLVYSPGATLVYNGGGGTVGAEWPATNGPTNITLQSSTGFSTLGGVLRTVNGTMTLNGGSFTIGAAGNSLVYSSGATLVYNGGSSIVGDEWPAANGPTNITVKSSIGFSTAGGVLRTVNGTMTLNGGSFTTGAAGNILTFGNGATIVRLTTDKFNAGVTTNGLYVFGTSSSDVINVQYGSATVTGITFASSNELPTTTIQSPTSLTGIVHCTVFPGNIVNISSSNTRIVNNLILNGTLGDDGTASRLLTVKGNILGSGNQTGTSTFKILMSGNTVASNISGASFTNLQLNDADGFALTGTPTVSGTLTLTAGTLNNSTNNISLGNGATVNRSAGSFTANPAYGTGVNVIYSGTGSVTSDRELTPSSGTIAALSVTGTGGTYTLASGPSVTSLTVNSGSTLDAAALTITNSGTSTINGNFKTAHASGVAGSISGSAPTIGSSSTIEYYSGSAQAVDLASYANLTLSGAGAKTFAANTTITGNFASSGGAVTAPALMTFSGTAQSVAGLAFTDATFSTSGTKTMTSDASVTGTLTVSGTAVLDADGASDNKVFTLKSTPTGTARVAAGNTAGGYISGNVTVERYIPANSNRAWRLLSVPTAGQTIKQAWQENQTAGSFTLTDYGTQITSSDAVNWSANGFDYNTGGTSMVTYDAANNLWVDVSATSGNIATTSGYLLYIRGDRRSLPSNTDIFATTLRTTGTLYQGDSQAALPVAENKYALIGNDFASAIDVRNLIITGNIDPTFYVIDPKLGTLGAYQTITFDGTNYKVATPGGGSYGAVGTIVNNVESGQAFFVHGTSAGGGGTVKLVEASKTPGSNNAVFTPTSPEERLITSLYAVNGNGNILTDGTLNMYDNTYSNGLDAYDARKLSNFGENIGMLRNGINLSVERRNIIGLTDTVFYQMTGLKQQPYQFVLTADNLNHPNLYGKLVDNYLGTSLNVDLNSTSTINFTVDANAGSSAANRFMFVFYTSVPVPVSFTSVKAYQQNSNIVVEWKVDNQINIAKYEIEKSTDGRSFNKVGTQIATGNNGASVTYNFVDVNAVTGDNFYRVKSIGVSGEVKYSTVVKVKIGKGAPAISVYPNPITDGTINVQFTDMAKGNYTIRLINNTGQTVMTKQVVHNGGSAAQTIALDKTVSKGNYVMEIVGVEKMCMKVVVE